ncbi:MAG: hypothetical protein M1511_12655 [Deltaproteobacteria bacterium]|nr:hypothetical protein [Deltaproteobacteria bacterium]
MVLRACGDDHLVKLCATVDDHTFVAASQAVRLFRVGPNKPEYIEVHYGFFGNSYSAYDVYVHEQ